MRLSIPIHGNRPLKLGLQRIWPSLPKYRTRKWAEALRYSITWSARTSMAVGNVFAEETLGPYA
jgi:hypothetical protein